MRKFIQSFYFKLSLVFLFILVIMAIVQFFLTVQSSSKFTNKVDQKLNINLANDMVFELQPLLSNENLDLDKIGDRIHYMMVMNPKVEIYLLDKFGKILAFFAEPGKSIEVDSVNLQPIDIFLTNSTNLPILGTDPRNVKSYKPFSAAKLQFNQKDDGYLYIIIGSEQYDYTTALLKENFIIQTMIQGLIISIVFAGILGLILFARLTKRIRTLSETVRDFEKGDYDKRILTDSNDEIGQLTNSFNQMADKIVANIGELKKTDDLRKELIANVSHDLRSPLASIQGYLETIQMKSDQLNREEKNNYLDIIHKNTVLLNKLVHELFDLSKLDAKQIEPKLENFSLAELVQDVVMKYQDQAKKFNIHLKANFQQNSPFINADIAMIERTLSNLIENALFYTPDGGNVLVTLSEINSKIRTSVSDTGDGIAKEDIPFIFDRYYKGKIRCDKDRYSTGLGLHITKKILELHNSTIFVESQESVGTTFYFDLN